MSLYRDPVLRGGLHVPVPGSSIEGRSFMSVYRDPVLRGGLHVRVPGSSIEGRSSCPCTGIQY